MDVAVIVQGEVIREGVGPHIDKCSVLSRKYDLGRHIRDIVIARVLEPFCAKVARVAHLTILWHDNRAFDDGFTSIFPFGAIVAHQERPVGVEMYSRQRQFLLLCLSEKITCQLEHMLEVWLSGRLSVDVVEISGPVIEQHLDLDFIHSEGVCIPHRKLFKQLEVV